MPYAVIQRPDDEPVSVAEVKQHLHMRDGNTSQDSWISAAISAAREYAEGYTRRSFCTQTQRLVLDAFPAGPIEVEQGPVQSISSFTYLDTGGVQRSLTQGVDYVADLVSEPARLAPPFGKVWPDALPQISVVLITFVAGYGEPSQVPESVRAWICMRVGAMSENREEIAVGRNLVVAPLPFVDAMLESCRVKAY